MPFPFTLCLLPIKCQVKKKTCSRWTVSQRHSMENIAFQFSSVTSTGSCPQTVRQKINVVCSRACNFRYITIEWAKPTTYGDTLVTGYKVYVNGVVETILGTDQFSFSFTQGHWCREYAFQVQVSVAQHSAWRTFSLGFSPVFLYGYLMGFTVCLSSLIFFSETTGQILLQLGACRCLHVLL